MKGKRRGGREGSMLVVLLPVPSPSFCMFRRNNVSNLDIY